MEFLDNDKGLGLVFKVGNRSYFSSFDKHGYRVSNVNDFSNYTQGLTLDNKSFYVVEYYKTGRKDDHGEEILNIRDLTTIKYDIKEDDQAGILDKYLELRKNEVAAGMLSGSIIEHCLTNVPKFNKDLIVTH